MLRPISRILSLLVLVGAPFTAGQVFAAKALVFKHPFCEEAKSIQPKGKFCQDNEVFTRGAERCLAKLRAKVEREGTMVKKLFSIKENVKSQSLGFEKSSVDHKAASRKLSELIKLCKQVELELDSYFDGVYLPVDYDSPDVNGGKPDDYALSVPCYGDTVRAIDSIIDDVDDIRLDLTEAKKVADSFTKELRASDRKLQKISGNESEVKNSGKKKQQSGLTTNKSTVSKSKQKAKQNLNNKNAD